jgi:uncharacterized membrane-anchored protein YitT (DUF2179 family)
MTLPPANDTPASPHRHQRYEDVLALLLGTLVVALGLTFYAQAGLATGGTAGISLLVHYATGFSIGGVFFTVNLPFYVLAIARMGWPFTLRTFAAVTLLSVFTRLSAGWISLASINPLYAAVAGGGLIGLGMLILFRHRAGLGGFNIVAVYLQDRYGLRAGYFQLCVDALILIAAIVILPLAQVGLSLVGAAVLNLVIAINHRPGRYVGVS